MAAGDEATRFLLAGAVEGGVAGVGGLNLDSPVPAKATLLLGGGCVGGEERRALFSDVAGTAAKLMMGVCRGEDGDFPCAASAKIIEF